MKNLRFLIVLMICILSHPAFAVTIRVQAMENFTTEKPTEYMSVKILDDLVLDEDLTIKNGCIIRGQVVDVISPKRLKRNANFGFIPLSYKGLDDNVIDIKGYYLAKYTTKLNKGEIAKSAALSVGNHFVKGLSLGYKTIEGAVKNEKNNRFKSGVNSLYEASPFSYVEKGSDIVIQKDQVFLLNFKAKNDIEDEEEKDLPNYEYEKLPSENSVEQMDGNKNSALLNKNEEMLINSDYSKNPDNRE